MRLAGKRQQRRLPEWEPPCGRRGRSVLRLVEIEARNVFEAVAEFFHYLLHGCGTLGGEDVCPQTRGFIGEMDEGEVGGFALGAFERIVGEVGEVALNGSFVGKYHIELI